MSEKWKELAYYTAGAGAGAMAAEAGSLVGGLCGVLGICLIEVCWP